MGLRRLREARHCKTLSARIDVRKKESHDSKMTTNEVSERKDYVTFERPSMSLIGKIPLAPRRKVLKMLMARWSSVLLLLISGQGAS